MKEYSLKLGIILRNLKYFKSGPFEKKIKNGSEKLGLRCSPSLPSTWVMHLLLQGMPNKLHSKQVSTNPY